MLHVFLILGIALLIGFFVMRESERLGAPHVAGFIVLGVILGVSFLNVFNQDLISKLDLISFIAIGIIGFEVGGELALSVIRKIGKSIAWITILEAFGAFVFVTLAVFLYTKKLYLALIFGGISSATAPATTVYVLREYKASGIFTSTIYAVVGLDDGVAVMLYAFASAFAKVIVTKSQISLFQMIKNPVFEIIGSLFLGIILGFLLHKIISRIHNREELLIVTFGFILLCTGAAMSTHLSLILANMAMGATLINLSHSRRPFEEIESISLPFFIIFFMLLGARLNVALLLKLGVIGILYILFRTLGKFAGVYAGAKISGAEEKIAKYGGFALFPQESVAIALAIQTMQEFSKFNAVGKEVGITVITIIAATTLVLELLGPFSTKYAIFRAGEAKNINNHQ